MDLYNKISEQLKSIGLADWANMEDIREIYDSVSRLKPGQTYLEIGVAYGASLAVACLAANPGVDLYGIDSIDQPGRTENIERFLKLNNKEKPVWVFINSDSQMEAKSWERGEINVLYIDGDHTEEGVLRDMVSWLPWVEIGGKIIFDDYNEKTGVKRAVDRIILNNNLYSDFLVDHENFTCHRF